MRQIQEATGVSEVGEVVQRFLSQGKTQEQLTALQETNSAKLKELQDEYAKVSREFEALKYRFVWLRPPGLLCACSRGWQG